MTTASLLLLLPSIKMNSVDLPEAFPLHDSLPGLLSITKRSLVVKTESNVWKEETKKPIPPCLGCGGNGKVNCRHCRGRGRTNCVHLAVLPKGVWPKWCKNCGGSGLDYCPRCFGSGEYQESMGFRFIKRFARDQNDQKNDP